MSTKFAILDPAIWERIWWAAAQRSQRHLALCVILRETGMHASSAASLRRHNVLPDRLRWKRPKKQARQRWLTCPLTPKLQWALAVWLRGNYTVSRQRVWKMVSDVGADAGYPDLAPLSFRHTRAVELIRRGLPPIYVEAVLGASHAVIRDAYGSLSEDQVLAELRRHGA